MGASRRSQVTWEVRWGSASTVVRSFQTRWRWRATTCKKEENRTRRASYALARKCRARDSLIEGVLCCCFLLFRFGRIGARFPLGKASDLCTCWLFAVLFVVSPSFFSCLVSRLGGAGAARFGFARQSPLFLLLLRALFEAGHGPPRAVCKCVGEGAAVAHGGSQAPALCLPFPHIAPPTLHLLPHHGLGASFALSSSSRTPS